MSKRKPLWARILLGIFNTVLSVVVLFLAFSAFLYFKYKINTFKVINHIRILNQKVDTDSLITKPFSDSDLTTAKAKIDVVSILLPELVITDKEVGAYINNTIQENKDGQIVDFGSIKIDLLDYGFKVEQVEFVLPTSEEVDKLADFNIVLKINLEKLKTDRMNKFPYNWIKGIVPNELYFSSTVEIFKNDEEGALYDYKIESKSLLINNLDSKDTEEIFDGLNNFSSVGKVDNFNKSICTPFVDALIGNSENPGIAYSLIKVGAISYSFEKIGNQVCFVVKK